MVDSILKYTYIGPTVALIWGKSTSDRWSVLRFFCGDVGRPRAVAWATGGGVGEAQI